MPSFLHQIIPKTVKIHSKSTPPREKLAKTAQYLRDAPNGHGFSLFSLTKHQFSLPLVDFG